jgi:deazaflavin-dependent oxidoreductase (nitroreductase family)
MASVLSYVLAVHDWLYKATDGRIGHKTLGVPSLLLHSTGAKSGEPRTTSLTYAQDGDRWLIVASKGGSPTAPAWLHNLRAHPDAEVQVGRPRIPVTAAEVRPGDPDYERLWKIVNDNNQDRYVAYQEKTTRPIPVVTLTPRGAAGARAG